MNKINLIGMDFDDIKTSIKDFFKQQDEFRDYNFDGSGLSVLLNALAYDAQHTAYLANMLANESNIDTAILRENVVSRAKLIGYTPHSKKAARAIISVEITDFDNQATSLLLPRGTKFIAGSGGTIHTFVTLRDYNLYLNETTGTYINEQIEIFEGSIKAASWTVETGSRFILNSLNVDTATLKVGVFPSYTTTAGEYYNHVIGLEKVKSNSTVFWLQETDGKRFEVLFGDDVFGKKPLNGYVVYCEYLDTNSTEANGYTSFSLSGRFAGYENSQISISTIASSTGGAESESTNSIKINAPRSFAAQGRAVTTEDYKSIVKELYPRTYAVHAWGGDEERPVKYGKMFISVIPSGGGFLTDYTKTDLVRQLNSRKVGGITPVFVDPEYLKFNVTAHVSVKNNSISALKNFSTEVKNLIETFFDEKFNDFDSSFYYSNLVTDIENYSRSIASVKIDFDVSIEDTIEKKVFDFKNQINEGSIRSNLLSIPENSMALSITDREGKIYLGNVQVGKVDYESGIVEFTKTTMVSNGNMLEVFATPTHDDVFAKNRTVLTLDKRRLSVELIAR